jgi:hypothetical protein
LIDSVAKLGGLSAPIPVGTGPHAVRMDGSSPPGLLPPNTAPLSPGLSPLTGRSTARPVVSTGAQAAVATPPRRNPWVAPVLVISALGLLGGGFWVVFRRPHAAPPADTATASAAPSVAATTAVTTAPIVGAPVTSSPVLTVSSVAPPSAVPPSAVPPSAVPPSAVPPAVAELTAPSTAAAASATATGPAGPEHGARGPGRSPHGPRAHGAAPPAWAGDAPRPAYQPPASVPGPSNTLGF